jgi:hypothetical protein
MAQERDEMVYGAPDTVTGERWVHVSRAAAHAHPKGRLHWAFWLVALWLFGVAVWEFRAGLAAGSIGWAAALAVLPCVTGVLVLLRAPIARILLIIVAATTIYGSVTTGLDGGFAQLAKVLVSMALTIWMWEGERPNLAYGYRFRGKANPDG